MDGDKHRDTPAELLGLNTLSVPQDRGQGNPSSESTSSSDPRSAGTLMSSVSVTGPSQAEINQYFYGLTGSPKLVARSSDHSFTLQFSGSFPAKKRMYNIGPHPIVNAYSEDVRIEIQNALKDVKWFAIDVIRIGYSYIAQENPVVVLVTVEPGSVPYLKALEAVKKCHHILKRKGLEVHVEMKEYRPAAVR